MADLSQDDRDIIAKNPLNGTLDHLRDALRRTERPYQSDPSPDEPTGDLFAKQTISRLLSTLQGHEAALELQSKSGQGDVTSELAAIVGRIRRNGFNYGQYRSLAQLIIKNASDIDIWRAVLDLTASLSQVTPPTSVQPSFDSTPVIYSSASQQGNEQTKRLLDPVLLHEFRNCTYRSVERFFSKYFEEKEWSGSAQGIYRALKDRHVDGRWTDFPNPPEEAAVWDWLSEIQGKLLTDARGVYYTTSTVTELTGAEAPRQLDLFLKKRTDTVDTQHDWKDVRVIGEHRVSNKEWKEKFLQLGRYVRDVFSVQPTRRFIHAFTLLGTIMELWVFDRSGPYSSGPFDIHEEPEKFIQVLAGYALMSDDELGLDTFIQHDELGPFIKIKEDTTGQEKKVQLEEQPMVINRAIVCRGTTCFRSRDGKQVLKMSWPSAIRPAEAKLLRLARDCGVEGVASLFACRQLTTIEEMRQDLKFPAPHRFRNSSSSASVSISESQSQGALARSFGPFQSLTISHSVLGKRKSNESGARGSKRSRSNSQQSKLKEVYDGSQEADKGAANQDDQTYNNRLFSCLVVSPAGRVIGEFRSIKELLTALRDAIKAHQSLFTRAKILHRDISENNIIITNPKTADGRTGMLIDLDLAIVDGERTGARHQTGTPPFMAIDVLLNEQLEHTYRHDLESFFYVLLWMLARRTWEREFRCKARNRPQRSVLSLWYKGPLVDIGNAKRGSMHADGFKDILKGFPLAFEGVKPLCRQLRSILFPLTKDGELDLSTPTDPKNLYGRFVSAVEAAIADTAAEDER